MKTILLFGNFFSHTTGVQSVSEELAEKLASRNIRVFTTSGYSNRILRLADYLYTATKHRKDYQVAQIAVYSDLAFRWAEIVAWVLRLLKKPYILTLHGGKLPEFAVKNPERVSRLLLSAYAVTSPSKYLHEAFSTIPVKIRYIPNGIELAGYPYNVREKIKPNLIWLRAFHQIYAPAVAVRVLHQLITDYPDAHLTMVGPDKGDGTFEETKKLVEELELTGAVTFTGAISKNKIGDCLSKSDIFLNTTTYESFGVSVLEAAACGLCIVTTNVGELPLLWQNESDALLVPPNDPSAMARAVKRLLDDPNLAQSLSANARKKAAAYDWSAVLPLWESLFDELN